MILLQPISIFRPGVTEAATTAVIMIDPKRRTNGYSLQALHIVSLNESFVEISAFVVSAVIDAGIF